MDVGYSALMTLAVAHDKGVPLTIIAAAGNYVSNAPISALLVAIDSPAKSARDLNGKTIAVNGIKNITQLATMAWSDANGGDSRTLSFVEMGFPEMPAALAARRIDAAFITEPLVSSAVRRNLGRVIGKPYDAIAPQFTISGWFTLDAWAKTNPGLVHKISSIFRQTSTWANTHDAESAQMLSTLTKLPLEVVGTMTRSRFAESMSAKNFQPIIGYGCTIRLHLEIFPRLGYDRSECRLARRNAAMGLTPTHSYEDLLGDGCENVLARSVDTLPAFADALSALGVQSPRGERWTAELLASELSRLAAGEGANARISARPVVGRPFTFPSGSAPDLLRSGLLDQWYLVCRRRRRCGSAGRSQAAQSQSRALARFGKRGARARGLLSASRRPAFTGPGDRRTCQLRVSQL